MTNTEILVRKIEEQDAHDVSTNLFLQTPREGVAQFVISDIQKMQTKDFIRLVAVADNQVIGQVAFEKQSGSTHSHIVEIFAMVVNENYRGRGVSTKLMTAGLAWAQEKGFEIAILSVRKGTHAQDVYTHMGFEIYGELKDGIKETWGDKKVFDEVFMCKRLGKNQHGV